MTRRPFQSLHILLLPWSRAGVGVPSRLKKRHAGRDADVHRGPHQGRRANNSLDVTDCPDRPRREVSPSTAGMVGVAVARYVRPKVFEALTGYTEEAVHTKIKRGVWLEGEEYIRAPDGNILISVEGFYRWAEGQRGARSEDADNILIPLRGVFELICRPPSTIANPTLGIDNLKVQKPAPDPFAPDEVEVVLEVLRRQRAKKWPTGSNSPSSPACRPVSRSRCSGRRRSAHAHGCREAGACHGPRQGPDQDER